MTDTALSRPQASAAVTELGWRHLMNDFQTSVPVQSMDEAARLATRLVEVIGDEADQHLRIDLRPGLVILTLQTAAIANVTQRDAQLARAITEVLPELGLSNSAAVGPRTNQVLELAIDTMDTAAIRPFWRAVLGYGDEPSYRGEPNSVIDPAGWGPSICFGGERGAAAAQPKPPPSPVGAEKAAPPHQEGDPRQGGGCFRTRGPGRLGTRGCCAGQICVCTWQGRD